MEGHNFRAVAALFFAAALSLLGASTIRLTLKVSRLLNTRMRADF
jgi:hypothetical protein